jgi:hypothetical protein
MPILSSRGVPDDVFLELQREAVREELKVVGDVDGWWDNGSFSRALRSPPGTMDSLVPALQPLRQLSRTMTLPDCAMGVIWPPRADHPDGSMGGRSGNRPIPTRSKAVTQ